MTVGCVLLAAYYLARCGVFVAVGQDSHLFTTYFGGQATTLISIVLLATVSFSMSTLSNEQQTAALRVRAVRDGLTGLLNRTEFFRLPGEELRRMRQAGSQAQLILADLDYFKTINDEQGHLAGDQALTTFANACTNAVRATDLVGRYGGEEFIFLLIGASPERAAEVTATIDDSARRATDVNGVRLPTVSYGITTLDPAVGLEECISFADSVLYRAKAAGRNRSIYYYSPGAARPLTRSGAPAGCRGVDAAGYHAVGCGRSPASRCAPGSAGRPARRGSGRAASGAPRRARPPG